MLNSHDLNPSNIMDKIKKIETNSAPQVIGPYSQAILKDSFLFISGQLPLDPLTGKLVEPDILIQVNQVLDNIAAILSAASTHWHQVVKCEIFLKNMSDFQIVNQEYGKRVSLTTPPARQTIQAAALPLDALVEISCIAHVE